jgi:hypothetical protein
VVGRPRKLSRALEGVIVSGASGGRPEEVT